MTDTQLALEICAEIRGKYKKTRLPFTLEPGEPGLTNSKVGGTPYLPRGEAWPVDGKGVPMTFLAQIDCARLSALPDFPHTGLLQFFIGADDVFGVEFDDMTDNAGFRVLYRETVDLSVTAADVPLPEPAEEDCTPLGDRPCRIVFQPAREQKIPESDFLFETLFVQEWNRRRPEKPLKEFWEFYSLFPMEERNFDIFALDEADDGDEDRYLHHQLDGFPFFTQSDPRSREKYGEFDTLLFQLDSDMAEDRRDLVLWGDCGVANFFISREALRRRDFSRVLYNWDCC